MSYNDLMFLSYNFNIYISSGPVLIDLFLIMDLIFLLFSMISNFLLVLTLCIFSQFDLRPSFLVLCGTRARY